MKIRNFRELNVWKMGMEIVLDVYKSTQEFPRYEQYGLISQMNRAAISIPANISEGFNRFYKKEFRHYLSISLGSCAELETLVEAAFQLKHLSADEYGMLIEKIDHESRMLTKLRKTVTSNL